MEPVLVIHGGAGEFHDTAVPDKLKGVERAVEVGSEILLSGGSAVDAVVAAVKVMEDDVAFSAGPGSVLNSSGDVEMDAIVMDGSNLQVGAVGAVRNVEHPVELARLVMEKSSHVLIVGDGANKFAEEQGMKIVPTYKLITKNTIDALEAFLQDKALGLTIKNKASKYGDVGTVGAVALDMKGNVACATSTGGLTGKHPGRLGDTPLAGCGGYAINKTGAVSASGTGESIIRVCLSSRILTSMQSGASPQEAIKEALQYMQLTAGSTAGAIVVSPKGEVGINFITNHMAWAFRRGKGEIQRGINEPPSSLQISK